MYEDALAKFNEAFALNDASLASQYRAGLMYYALGRYAEGHANFSAVCLMVSWFGLTRMAPLCLSCR